MVVAPDNDVAPTVELVVLEYHWYVRDGVPFEAVMVSAARVPPTQTGEGLTGLTEMEGSGTTVTAAMVLVASPQPEPEALAMQK